MPSTARRSRQTVLPLGSARCSGSWVRGPVMVMLFIAVPFVWWLVCLTRPWVGHGPAGGAERQRGERPRSGLRSPSRTWRESRPARTHPATTTGTRRERRRQTGAHRGHVLDRSAHELPGRLLAARVTARMTRRAAL